MTPVCLAGSQQLPDDEPGEQHTEAADLAGDGQRHRHLSCAIGVFELVDSVAPPQVGSDRPGTEFGEDRQQQGRERVEQRGAVRDVDGGDPGFGSHPSDHNG
jgi:hypothetical protein